MTVEGVSLTWFEPIDVKLVASELDHVLRMVRQGYIEGELLAGEDNAPGWWKLVRHVED